MKVLLALLLVFVSGVSFAEEVEEEKVRTPVQAWLVKGPVKQWLPAFHDETPGGFSVDDLISAPTPAAATLRPVERADGWVRDDAVVNVEWAGVGEVWLATYIASDRYQTVGFELGEPCRAKAWLDGAPVELSGDEPAGELTLEAGKSLLLVRLVLGDDPAAKGFDSISLSPMMSPEDPLDLVGLSTTVDPDRPVDIRDVLDAPKISALAVSPDGKFVAVTLGAHGPDGGRETWLEIRSTKDGHVQRSWRGVDGPGGVQWRPGGTAISYTARDGDKTTLWVCDLVTETVTPLLRGVERFESYAWNPDGESLVYAFGVEAESDDRQVKRLEAVEDRWPWWRNRSYLVEVGYPGGAARRLTAGDVSARGWSFSPEGTHLLFSRTWPDPQERPYSRTEWFELDLSNLRTQTVLTDRWIGQAGYGKDRDTLVLIGSPSSFDGLGRDLPEGVVPNDYGGQLFLYDRGTGQPRALSRDFDPTVQSAVWHRSGRVVARVLDRQLQRLAVCTPSGEWDFLESGVEVVDRWETARGGEVLVCTGTSTTGPQKLQALTVGGDKPRTLCDPGADRYEHVRFGRVDPFVAELEGGAELDGRVYYPLDYDPGRSYPVIVYYYGGTYPITRDFGGRYPKNVWAGQDYFVYVPNPSGALGYGQDYAARHVNDWGKLTAAEVIAGTKAFLAAHPAADPEAVGCIGASYGGFLTMYLITQTDLFRAAAAHAGISSISSYWAEGYWGYGYGARALANSFPWNAKELYVEQSPLFHADRIETPLLLLHGFDDTNVPKGESDGLYIALKMLGKEVEYVQVEGQDHHILDHDRRVVWNDTILAWFARELKDRPAWWEGMYPEKE